MPEIKIENTGDLMDFLGGFAVNTKVVATWEGINVPIHGYEYDEKTETLHLDVDNFW